MGEPPATASARPEAAAGVVSSVTPSAAAPGPTTPGEPEPAATAAIRWVLPIGIVALCVSVVGGYGFHWAWTGVTGRDQLWDLLHVIVLPIVLATLPIWYRTRERWMVEWRIVLGLIGGAFAILVVGGYGLGWDWTGFAGNTLWDWLELLALPLVIASLPLWFTTHTRWEGRWRRFGLALLAGFVLTVVGGYALGWGWTGTRATRSGTGCACSSCPSSSRRAWPGSRRGRRRSDPCAARRSRPPRSPVIGWRPGSAPSADRAAHELDQPEKRWIRARVQGDGTPPISSSARPRPCG